MGKLQINKCNIVGIGSVAALRARKTNPVYASCKRGLEFYLQGSAQ